MKTSLFRFLILLNILFVSFAFTFSAPGEELALDAPIPMGDYKMKDITGKSISLNEIKKDKGLLVIFSCNTCPYVKLSAARLKEYSDLALSNNIGVALINSNEALRNEDDSFDEMVKFYNAHNLKCCYTVDEKSQLADAFGAGRTPQCFLFGSKGLAYKGAIDDNVKDPAAVKETYLKDAILAVAKQGKPKTQTTKSIGCTIKRLE